MSQPRIQPSASDYAPLTGRLRRGRGPTGAELRAVYDADTSISVRSLAEEHRVSYGTVHRRLKLAGTTFRPRGGVPRSATTHPGTPDQRPAPQG